MKSVGARRVTMEDVARLANVSAKTVSNVLNGNPKATQETKERVLEAVDRLGYRLNVTARNLRQGRTGQISLAIPELKNPYFGELADLVLEGGQGLRLQGAGPANQLSTVTLNWQSWRARRRSGSTESPSRPSCSGRLTYAFSTSIFRRAHRRKRVRRRARPCDHEQRRRGPRSHRAPHLAG